MILLRPISIFIASLFEARSNIKMNQTKHELNLLGTFYDLYERSLHEIYTQNPDDGYSSNRSSNSKSGLI